jgi:predicted nucleic acid-binding protein
VLYPNLLRDLLIRVAQAGLVQAKWTNEILEETFRNLKEDRPDLDPAMLDRTRELMGRAIRDVLIKDYEPLIPMLELPDANDRHVLAAAIKARAQVIVTTNIKDFPKPALSPWQIEAQHPDEFVHDLVDLHPKAVFGEVQRIADSTSKPPLSVDEVLTGLSRCGLVESVAALRS